MPLARPSDAGSVTVTVVGEGRRESATSATSAPALRAKDAAMASDINARFDAVQKELATLKQGDAYPSYDTVDDAERRQLSVLVAGLAKPLAKLSDALG